MKISVMGIDYNQLLSGKALAEMGNDVTYVSKDNKRIENIRRGYYNAEEAMVIKNMGKESLLDFTSCIKDALHGTKMCFIAEGYNQDSHEETLKVLQLAKEVGENMNNDMFIVDRSEISQSRAQYIKETIQEELKKRNKQLRVEVIANPDFLRA